MLTLIRHNSLVAPYNNYEALSIEQMDQLGTNAISPDIAPLPDLLPLDPAAENTLRSARWYICSSAPRTRQTCEALLRRLNIDPAQKEILVDPDADEIFFTPSLLRQNPEENPLHAVRKNLYPAIRDNKDGIEPLASISRRITALREKYEGKPDTVIFSHGFLIRLIKGAAPCNYDLSAAIDTIANIPPINYLEVTTIL